MEKFQDFEQDQSLTSAQDLPAGTEWRPLSRQEQRWILFQAPFQSGEFTGPRKLRRAKAREAQRLLMKELKKGNKNE